MKVHYYKNVELFCKDLIDIALKCGRYISQSKRYDLIFKVAIADLEGRFSFVAFLNLI